MSIQEVNGIKVVTLSPAEELEYERLTTEKNEAQHRLWKLEIEAREAVKRKNVAKKQFGAIQAKWLVLAEKKFPR